MRALIATLAFFLAPGLSWAGAPGCPYPDECGDSSWETVATIAALEECVEETWGATEVFRGCRLAANTETVSGGASYHLLDWPDTTGQSGLTLTYPDIPPRGKLIVDFGGVSQIALCGNTGFAGGCAMDGDDADNVIAITVDLDNVDCGADNVNGQFLEIQRLRTFNQGGASGTGDKSMSWLVFTHDTAANDCNMVIRDSDIGSNAGILDAEAMNPMIVVEESTALDIINTNITAVEINSGRALVEIAQARIAGHFNLYSSRMGGVAAFPCMELVDHTGTNGVVEVSFFDYPGASQEAQPSVRPKLGPCSGFLISETSSKGFWSNGLVHWTPGQNTDALFTLDNTTGSVSANLWLDLDIYLQADAGAIYRLGNGVVDGIQQIAVDVVGNTAYDLTNIIDYGTSVTARLSNLRANINTGSTPISCTTFADSDAITAHEAADVLLGFVQSHGNLMLLKYTDDTDCVAYANP